MASSAPDHLRTPGLISNRPCYEGIKVRCVRSRRWLNVHDAFGAYLCRHLAEVGIATVRFQFPYMERKSRRPDPGKVMEATWRQIIEAVGPIDSKIAIGGRSMGGRIASHVVEQGMFVDALALFSYPLNPPERTARRRDEHLPAISVPTLFCSGTRDTFATPEELKAAASLVPVSHVHLMEGADHGFGVLKSSGRSRQDVWQEATSVLIQWLNELSATTASPS